MRSKADGLHLHPLCAVAHNPNRAAFSNVAFSLVFILQILSNKVIFCNNVTQREQISLRVVNRLYDQGQPRKTKNGPKIKT